MFLYKKIIKTLIQKNISIAVAESCTGGKISYLISTVPGVSKIFDLGLVTYSNNSKFKILKVPKSIINKHGAVSEEVSRLMIKNLTVEASLEPGNVLASNIAKDSKRLSEKIFPNLSEPSISRG